MRERFLIGASELFTALCEERFYMALVEYWAASCVKGFFFFFFLHCAV